jgi:translation initiation factor eIF-2B subunit epsilon
MPSRKNTSESDNKQERPTAVLLADSFSCHFQPITLETPKVLLPLVNACMLDYTLEWLIVHGIETIYITCCAFADQIQRHLDSAGYLNRKGLHVDVIVSTDCMSVGDAMRLLDHKDILKSGQDFVVVSGDVVTNMDLRGALAEHRQRRLKDASAIMTMVLKGGMVGAHRLRLGDLGATTIMDEGDNRLLKFEERRDGEAIAEGASPNISLDASYFDSRTSVTMRNDLIDTGIYICSHEVLMLFSDNFDYQNIRKDFVAGVLSEEELGNKLYVHEVKNRYATRVRNVRCFAAVTKDILSRWTFPFVPDANVFKVCGNDMDSGVSSLQSLSLGGTYASHWGSTETRYTYSKGNVYLDDGVAVARTASIQHSVCVGRGSVLGPGTVLRDCVIGKNCRIGENAEIVGCILGDDVTIHRNSSLRDSLLCDGVVVNEGTRVMENSILSYNVIIDSNVTVPADSRISLAKNTCPGGMHAFDIGSDDDDDEDRFGVSPSTGFSVSFDGSDIQGGAANMVTAAARSAAMALAHGGVPETKMDFDDVVGKMGAGYLWDIPEGTKKNPFINIRRSIAYGMSAAMLEEQRRVDLMYEAEDAFLDGEFSELKEGAGRLSESESDADAAMEMMQDHHFKEEVAETFLRCIKENISQENVVIELNGLKIAEDKTFADCARFILTTCLGLCLPPPAKCVSEEYKTLYAAGVPGSLRELLKRTQMQLKTWASLLQKFLKNEDDQVEVLLTLEEFCGQEGDFEETGEMGEHFVGIFPQLLQLMYELDILTEDAVLAWAEEKEHANETEKRFLNLAAPFIEWLEEASEEESDSDEE